MTARPHLVLTVLALVAFAGNSVIARLALAEGDIGAGSYTAIRLLSGAAVLLLLVRPKTAWVAGTWPGAFALLGYAAGFSYAYLSLATGTGALILFALVQVTMLGAGFRAGERLDALQWAGVALAFAGLTVLLSPSLDAPSPLGALLMALAGISWGIYSLLGRSGGDPTARTAGNFARASFLALPLMAIAVAAEPAPTPPGVLLAVLSGAVTSGLGYAVWYRALPHLSASRAGVVQLSVPPLAALLGILLLSEPLTLPFASASLFVLLGIWLAGRRTRQNT